MTEWANNPWVIGIVGGLIVTAISRYLFSRRDNKEYRQKVVTANQEILYAIRPGVSEGKIASLEVLKALIAATSSKYGVEETDLYNYEEISNHLIKEIMDSSFISVELKQKFCEALSELRLSGVKLEQTEPQIESERPKLASISEYREKLVLILSVTIGVITTVMTLLVFFLDKVKLGLDKDISIVIPTVASMIAVLFSALIMPLLKMLKNKESVREKFKQTEKDENKTS